MVAIRGDLEGVVTAYDEGGAPVILAAGDEVPDGVQVGDHALTAAQAEADAKAAAAKAPAKKAAASKTEK